MPRLRAVVTGGGTSGHVLPALAVLEALEDGGIAAADLGYVGCRRGVERALVADFAYVKRFLPIDGLQRSMSPRAIGRNLMLPIRVAMSYSAAVVLALRWRPEVIVSVGGYASAPMAFAGRVARVPLVCVSYDAIPGLATRRQSRHAVMCATAFPDSQLPNSVHTGAPVRRAIRQLDAAAARQTARRELGVPESSVLVTVMGGSQGSAALNAAVPAILDVLSSAGRPTALLHISGERFNGAAPIDAPSNVWYSKVGYESRIREVLAATDVFVCRSGAGTIAEISTVGVAAVLVPWKAAADDHQSRNAQWLARDGGAVVLDEAVATPADIARAVAVLVTDDMARHKMADIARANGEQNRTGTLSRALLSVMSGPRPHSG